MQYFKGDATEIKYFEAADPLASNLLLQADLFFADAYTCHVLGDLIYELDAGPLTAAIRQDIYREAFGEIFQAFIDGGTFEAYLTVFKKIFGDDVVVEFTVPAPGKLAIDIEATGVVLSDFVARYIVDNVYLFDEVIDDEDDNIVFQTIKGFTSQFELETMLFQMVPNGIWTEISLTLGG